jgi:hypothetical protein
MKSEGQQIDFIDQQRLAGAYRVAADFVMYDPHFDDSERKERREWYLKEADKLEGRA